MEDQGDLVTYKPYRLGGYPKCFIHSILQVRIYGRLSKLWSLFGSLLEYGTYYLGYPKRDQIFDNHPYIHIYLYITYIYIAYIYIDIYIY